MDQEWKRWGTIWWGGLLLNINILATVPHAVVVRDWSALWHWPHPPSSGCVERINQNQNILHTWLTPVHLTLTALYPVWYYSCLIFCLFFFYSLLIFILHLTSFFVLIDVLVPFTDSSKRLREDYSVAVWRLPMRPFSSAQNTPFNGKTWPSIHGQVLSLSHQDHYGKVVTWLTSLTVCLVVLASCRTQVDRVGSHCVKLLTGQAENELTFAWVYLATLHAQLCSTSHHYY